ncbi:MAG: hypothetical protein GTO14_11490 [Anaerolineales bacterium]|nr:hypothetical protein [Anaerolineales bacterium]
MSESPFFIVGCGRSGTTLLRTLLNRHPVIAIPLESLFIVDYLRAASRFDLSLLKSLLIREPEIQEWGIKPTLKDLQDCHTVPEAIGMLHHMYLESRRKRQWGQKTPRFVRHMDLILTHFPNARFIHLVRDPRAVVSSLMRSDVHRSNALHASLRWRMDVRKGFDFEQRHPERVIRIYYEDLVRNAEEKLRHILAFLSLPYDASLEEPGETARDEYTRFYQNIHANIDRMPTDQYINKWKDDLSRRDVEVVESINGEMMGSLGYEREFAQPTIPGDYAVLMRIYRLRGLLRQTYHYLRHRRAYLLFLFWRKWRLGLLKDFLWTVNY